MKRQCGICRSEKRIAIEADLRGAVPFREIEKRHHVSTTMAFRHRSHMDVTPAAGADTEEPEYDEKAILKAAQKALVRAMRKNDVRAIDTAYSLLQKIQRGHGSPGASEPSSSFTGELSDEQLAEKRRRLFQLVYRQNASIEELHEEIRAIQEIIREKEAQCGSVITLPAPVAEPESNIRSTTASQNEPESESPAEPVNSGGAHYSR